MGNQSMLQPQDCKQNIAIEKLHTKTMTKNGMVGMSAYLPTDQKSTVCTLRRSSTKKIIEF